MERKEKTKNIYKILVGKYAERDHFEDPLVDFKIINPKRYGWKI
jgi:hypothetical protein